MNDKFLTHAQSAEVGPAITQDFVGHPTGANPQRRLWTREEYYKMAEANILAPYEHVELIEGEILQMPPQGPSP